MSYNFQNLEKIKLEKSNGSGLSCTKSNIISLTTPFIGRGKQI
jgi:hypothetical protein